MVGAVFTRVPAVVADAWSAVALQSDSSDGTLAVIVFFFVGLFLVYGGFTKWQQMRLVQDTPTEKIRSAAVGRTELKGTAEPIEDGGTIEQPFTDGECLVATYTVKEWDDDSDDDGGSWETIASGTLLTPFAVNDGTGRMRVEPVEDATYEFEGENQTTVRVGAGNRPPDAVVDFFERQYASDDGGLLGGLLHGGPDLRGSDKRRYSQSVLPPGEDVYLLGAATPADGASGSNADRLVLGPDEGSGEFIISDLVEDELVSNYRWAAPGMILGGIALSAAMLYLLLS